MMKKLAVFIASLFFVMCFTLRVMAEEPITMFISTAKEVFSGNERYAILFHLSGSDFKDVKKAVINIPNDKKMTLKNSLKLTHFDLARNEMGSDKFNSNFPEGNYTIVLDPKEFGSLTVNLTHSFPEVPKITQPENGASDIGLTPKIIWEPLSGIDSLNLSIFRDGDNTSLSTFVSPVLTSFEVPILHIPLSSEQTSFEVPKGILQTNTMYEVQLSAIIGEETGNSTRSIRTINFTTASD